MPNYVRLLGSAAIRHKDEWLEPSFGLPSALLYFLAYKNTWVTRETLAFTFWPDVPEENARKNLRNLLARLKKLNYADLEIERSRVRWQVETDVKAFYEAIQKENNQEVLELYKGDLLETIQLEQASEFNEWLEFERDELRMHHQTIALQEVGALETQQRFNEAAKALEPLREADPFDEGLLRRQLENYYAGQQTDFAFKLYEAFKKMLAREFFAEPEQATLKLIEEFQKARGVAAQAQTRELQTTNSNHNLPKSLTPFLGRDIELKRIAEQLADPGCRLLTLLAPGGMGKTRLSLAAAYKQIQHFKQGVCFVAFADVTEPEQMLYAVANALNLFSEKDSLIHQLKNHLQDKEMLLVFDNLEQLSSNVMLISDLLEAAPKIKILATSRERLNLRSEWLFDLRGLSYPGALSEASAKTYDAVKLFLQRAQQLDVDLKEKDVLQVVRICQLVEGMPLAIELAASWLRLMPVEEIVTDLEQGLDILETSLRDVPERHQSVRAVFEYSWRLLSHKLQAVLMKISVFRGGFERAAAQAVAAASTRDLLELVSKSLIRRQPTGRYDLHSLVQQFAFEKLSQQRSLREETVHSHGEFFLGYLRNLDEMYQQGRQREVLAAIEADRANVAAVWLWAAENKKLNELSALARVLKDYYVGRMRFYEGIDVFQHALEKLDVSQVKHHTTIGTLYTAQGWFYLRAGQFKKAIDNVRFALDLLQPLGQTLSLAEAYNLQGVIYGRTGHYKAAQSYFEQALSLAQNLRLMRFSTMYLNNLAITEKELGAFTEAEKHYRETLKLNRQLKMHLSTVRNLNNLGLLLLTIGELEEAKRCLEEGLEVAEEMGLEQTKLHLLSGLGHVMYAFNAFPEAKKLFDESLKLAKEMRSKDYEADFTANLAKTALALNHLDQAKPQFKKALTMAHDIKNAKTCLLILVEVAGVHAVEEDWHSFVELLRFVMHHEATDSATKARAEQLVDRYCKHLAKDELTCIKTKPIGLELDQVIHKVSNTLS